MLINVRYRTIVKRPYIHRTPVVTSSTLDTMASLDKVKLHLLMKCENLQKVGGAWPVWV